MDSNLEEQLVNHLRDLLRTLNDEYKDFFHFQLLTIVDMKDQKCDNCAHSVTHTKCLRGVVGYEQLTSNP